MVCGVRAGNWYCHAPGIGTAADHGDNAGVDVVSLQDTGHHVCKGNAGERGGGGALPHVGVASNEGEGKVPAGNSDGEVEGGNDADHAAWVPLLHEGVVGALGREDAAVDGAAEAKGKVANVHVLLHLAAGLGQDLAVLEGEQLGEGLNVRAQLLTNLAHNLAAGRHGQLSSKARKGRGSQGGGGGGGVEEGGGR